jgi:MFS family permease
VALRSVSRALRHRNYRLFFTGQSISLVGTWLTRVATSWLVYRLTNSALLLGIVGFAGQIPTLLLAPFAGVFVDRLDRHRVLVVTQVAAMIQSALLAFFALSGTITVVHVLLLSALQGIINAIDMPARQSFVVEMVTHREDLPNAIALNSSMVNAARLLGPSIAGILIAAVGEGWCFAIDAVSYLAVIGSLLAMHVVHRAPARVKGRVLAEIAEGARYAAAFAPIRSILLLLSIVSLMGMPYSVLMPVIASQVLSGGPHTLGFLMASSGLGALLGTLYLASRGTVLGLGRIIAAAAAGFGLSLMLLSWSRVTWLSMVIIAFAGMSMMVQMAASNTVLQTVVDDDKRGRVMSFYTMALVGTAPFGSLFAGATAARFGAPVTLLVGGAACLGGAALFTRALPRLRKLIRPVYERLGILPVATGLQSAANLTSPPQS